MQGWAPGLHSWLHKPTREPLRALEKRNQRCIFVSAQLNGEGLTRKTSVRPWIIMTTSLVPSHRAVITQDAESLWGGLVKAVRSAPHHRTPPRSEHPCLYPYVDKFVVRM